MEFDLELRTAVVENMDLCTKVEIDSNMRTKAEFTANIARTISLESEL